MNDLGVLKIAVNAVIQACDENGKETAHHDNDPFMRGFAAAHRKIGAFLSAAVEKINHESEIESALVNLLDSIRYAPNGIATIKAIQNADVILSKRKTVEG